MRRGSDGFTLIELAVVLLVIAVSITIVFPKLDVDWVQRARLRSTTNRIANIAEYAHQRAACARLTHLLNIDAAQGTYWVTSQTSEGKGVPITDNLGLKGRLPEGVQFAEVELLGTDTSSQDVVMIRFNPQGWADPAIVHLTCSTGDTMSVVIDELSGQVETFELGEMN
ncbi:Tfp pilus assembly protein FimT/FimU [Planctomycetota bacterium]